MSNCWLIVGKLWENHSRLYRSRCLQVNSKYSFESSRRDLQDLILFWTFGIQSENQEKRFWQASHRFEFKNSTEFRQTFSHVVLLLCSFILKSLLILSNVVQKLLILRGGGTQDVGGKNSKWRRSERENAPHWIRLTKNVNRRLAIEACFFKWKCACASDCFSATFSHVQAKCIFLTIEKIAKFWKQDCKIKCENVWRNLTRMKPKWNQNVHPIPVY